MKERRKLERFDFEVPAQVEGVISDEEGRMCDLSTTNICAGGAFFRTADPLPEGTKVKMQLVLPLDRIKELVGHDRVNVRVEGTVIRCGSTGMAVCFNEDYQIFPLQNPLD
ncbi:MAG: PilZ domain-containing protein [Deltaproteobacteria bacterium]|nr:PilZ domain-containing protein [Deltaproteobacteria bacterium]